MVKEKLMEKNDWQQRTELLLGEEKMNRIRKAHVLVVGLGGSQEKNLRTERYKRKNKIRDTICFSFSFRAARR